MQKHRNDGQARKHRSGVGRRCGALMLRCLPICLFGAATVVGCQHSPPQNNAATNDPLFGSIGSPAPPRPAAAPAKNTQANLPPPPTPSSLTSNAALAGANANAASRDPANDLRINDTVRSPVGRSEPASHGWSGTTLQRPEAVVPGPSTSSSPLNPALAPSPIGAETPTASLEQALAQLQARGATFVHLDYARDQDQWQVDCSVPNPQNAAVSRRYTAKARTSLEAVRAVMAQID